MEIQLLDSHTAELIAAGEVVERPSSVVKELVENAIDAGATSVQVEIERGGITLMRISDNGRGIRAEEIPLAFLRHATSKVRTQEDLNAIHTLGFRGEALASIASVAQVEMLTATGGDEFASVYHIHGGTEQGLEPGARPVGTTVTIRNLFYNTPARMKFLKKDASEATYVGETMTRLALSHPQIAFRFVRDGRMALQTPGDGKLKTAVYAVLGADFARQLVPVSAGTGPYRVEGLVTSPLAARASRAMQFFYINGRFIKNRTMMAALEQAYRGTTMQGKFPGCVLFLTMPADLVDVNVHPSKTEVRFAREKDVFTAVYQTVKSAVAETAGQHKPFSFGGPLGEAAAGATGQQQPSAAPAAAPNQGSKPAPSAAANPLPPPAGQIRAYNRMVGALASDSSYIPYRTALSPPVEQGLDIAETEPAQRDLEQETQNIERIVPENCGKEPEIPAEQTSILPRQEEIEPLRLVGEIFRTYILAERGDLFCIIDKHAAHERLLYEKLARDREEGEAAAQQLLSPVAVQVSGDEKNALLQNRETLLDSGVEVDDFGEGSVLVRSIPAGMESRDVESLVVELAGRLVLNARDTVSEKQQWVLHSIACRAAVKAGDKTPDMALLGLALDILDEKVPPFCPHGRPVVLEMTRKELEKQFGRLG